MYDKGNGFDSADVVANGPGRLETQPDRGQPVERIAIWQDKLELQNELAADGKIKQKIIMLTGNRPCFDDRVRGAKLDSGQSIEIVLVPETAQQQPDTSIGSGGFDIKRLMAVRDVHLIAPGKNLTARKRFDADFDQVAPAYPVVVVRLWAHTEDVPAESHMNPAQSDEQVAATHDAPQKSNESPMVGSAERIWVKIEMRPKSPGILKKVMQPKKRSPF